MVASPTDRADWPGRRFTFSRTIACLLTFGCLCAPASAAETAPGAASCSAGPPPAARCLRGQDSAGAHYLIVLPEKWNQVLVLHAHGGPALGQPKVERADADIERWGVIVRAGYAYAASVFRQGGVAVRSAAEDTERLRQIFVSHVAKPRRTILHGQSWGAGVAAKAAEMQAASAAGGPATGSATTDAGATDAAATDAGATDTAAYDGVLLSSGVLAGGSRSYDFRLDLRVAYQFLCGNHPKADEEPYPLWMGLPEGSKLSRKELAARVDECLGIRRKADQRSKRATAKTEDDRRRHQDTRGVGPRAPELGHILRGDHSAIQHQMKRATPIAISDKRIVDATGRM